MSPNYLKIKTSDRDIEGIYRNAGPDSPLAIIVNGHNGFYTYGMFPHVQEKLCENGISSYSFNFSHGGIIGDSDNFEELDKYEKNCIRLVIEDILVVLTNLSHFQSHPYVFILSHSLGGIPAIFSVRSAARQGIQLQGIILLNSVSALDFWPPEMMEEWKKSGVFYKKNNRTKQDLPLGREFLEEVLHSAEKWNTATELKAINIPILIIHGDEDEAVPFEHGLKLSNWARETNSNTTLRVIKGASHTFNTKHPFEGTSAQADEMISTVVEWVKNLSSGR